MTNPTPQPDSPEDILKEYQLATRHAFIPDVLESHKQHALAKLDEYYTNKFLEIVGLPQEHHPTCRSILVEPDDYCDCGILAVNEFKTELRQAIKQLSKRGE